MEFIGREAERKKLRGMFREEGLRTALIWGRRRVGKSELIKQCLRSEETAWIYHECARSSERNNVESLSGLTAERFNLPALGFGSMESLLEYLFQRSVHESLILVLDEYPCLRRLVPEMDSILRRLIDRYRGSGLLKLVLCGSDLEIMRSLREEESPLYGRIDLAIALKPMDYRESALFYPDFSPEDRVRLYSVFGGIPSYNRLIDPSLTVRENIQNLVSAPDARLENEIPLSLMTGFSRIENANLALEALAGGHSKFSDLLSRSRVSSSPALTDVLEKLIRMELVEKRSPINGGNNPRRSGYRIADNLTLFCYRYLFRFLSQRAVMDPDTFFDRYIRDDFETGYVPGMFRRICGEYLIRRNLEGGMDPAFDRIGKYWYRDSETGADSEFDPVTEDPLGYTFYCVKFRGEPVSRADLDREIRQVRRAGLMCYRYGFISGTGFQCEPTDHMIFLTLEDLFS